MDGLGRLSEGLGRLKDVLGRLGLIERFGVNDRDRLNERFCRPLLDRGADRIDGDGARLIGELGLELNDRDPIELPRFVTEGRDGICGERCTLGAELLDREAAPLLRLRDCPQAEGPASTIETTTATIRAPETRFLAFRSPAARHWFFSRSANIVALLSPRRWPH